jgi:NAD+ synthase
MRNQVVLEKGVFHLKICTCSHTSETFSLLQTQEEFFFEPACDSIDICHYAVNHEVAVEEVTPEVNLIPSQVVRVFKDIQAMRCANRYVHKRPLLVDPVAVV